MKIAKMGLILLFWASLSGVSLAVVFLKTDTLIEKAREERVQRILEQEILPLAVKFESRNDGTIKSGYDRQGQEIVKIVLAARQGYSGRIEMIVGIDNNGKVTTIKISKETETPGLGKKIAGNEFLLQFSGKSADEINLRKDDPHGTIDAIAGATISSRAVVQGIKESLAKISN